MTPVERYALTMVCEGAESRAEDDLNEDGAVSEDEHEAACLLALRIVRALRSDSIRRQVLLEWARGEDS